jgi:hypothetical protein
MVRRALTVLCLGLLTLSLTSCGQTYELQSITVAPDGGLNIEGVGKSGTLTVTAHYSNTKTSDVTAQSTFQLSASNDDLAPLSYDGVPVISVSNSGIVKISSNVGLCTWHATPTDSPTDSTFGYTTEPYTVTITYSGFTTTAPVSVDSAGDCYDGQTYPAPKGFLGN